MTSQSRGGLCLIASFLVVSCYISSCWAQRLVYEIHGSGSSTVINEFTQAMYTLMGTAKPAVYTTFRSIGSSGGRDEFVASNAKPAAFVTPHTSFGVSGLPLPTSNFSSLVSAGSPPLQVPLMITKVSFFTSALAATTGAPQVLNLTACTIAKIYTGLITTWDHADIKATNPSLNVKVNTPITVLRRSATFSPSQQSAVQFMATSCPAVWTWNTDLAAIPWPVTHKAMDNDRSMFMALSPNNQGMPGYYPNAIGFIDSGEALLPQNNLTQVALQVGGTWQTASTFNDSLLMNALPTSVFPAVDADWGSFNMEAAAQAAQPNAWPMMAVQMLLLRKNSTFLGAHGGLLNALVNVVLGDDQQAAVIGQRHTPLPSAYRQSLIAQVASKLVLDPLAPAWTFEYAGSSQTYTGAADYTFSAWRANGLIQASVYRDALAANITALQNTMVNVWSNLSVAQQTRVQLAQAIQLNADTEAQTRKAFQIAVAGIVISVLLAFIALVIAAVYVSKLKGIDDKYSQYLKLDKFHRGDPESL